MHFQACNETRSLRLLLESALRLAGENYRIINNILEGKQESSSDGALANLGTDTYKIDKSRGKEIE